MGEEGLMSDSLITKKAIASGLKELTLEKSFNKISIKDITNQCGLNRQTFYYHFQDKYELINWIYYQEGFAPLMEGITLDNWHLKVKELLILMKSEQTFYYNTISSDERYFKEFLLNITITLFKEAIKRLDEKRIVKKGEQNFIAEFYAYGVCGMIIAWVNSGMKEDPHQLAFNLKDIAINSERLAYVRYNEEN